MAVNIVPIVVFAGLTYIVIGLDAASTNVGIYGGHNITIEEAPYMASLWVNGTFHCGASIINEQFILTAAHCTMKDEKYSVKVGTTNATEAGQLYDVEKIIKHELFNFPSPDNDISLIKLNTSLTFSAKVNKTALANDTVVLEEKTEVKVTGWGSTETSGFSSNLKQVTIPVVSTSICNDTYIAMLHIPITDRMFCAGEEGKDSCKGDSGGPLTLNNVQVGITSFGAGCGVVPGVYTKISAMLPWINENIQKNL